MQELIIIKQLPQIEEHLKELSTEVDKKVENAKGLICTEENVKTIKQVRADLNKEFKEVEKQRKEVKEKVLAPYMQFEMIYKEYISEKYRSADNDLKKKIDTVESELKAKKEQEVKDYFEEYKTTNNIDFITYEQARINVTLSASMKSLKEQAKQFIDKIADDLKLIETQQHKAEILVEYKQTLNISNAITTVMNRFEAIEEEKKKQEKLRENELQKIAESVETEEIKKEKDEFVIVPTKKEITIKFNLYEKQLQQLIKFLDLSNIEYEREDI
ncbi:MAG: DUF1351 domain-containing protein [Clostridia bacterium]|nr:DUF1351 domain-containing protein [Clostridia bacterium]